MIDDKINENTAKMIVSNDPDLQHLAKITYAEHEPTMLDFHKLKKYVEKLQAEKLEGNISYHTTYNRILDEIRDRIWRQVV